MTKAFQRAVSQGEHLNIGSPTIQPVFSNFLVFSHERKNYFEVIV
jgi:hypothetical protein